MGTSFLYDHIILIIHGDTLKQVYAFVRVCFILRRITITHNNHMCLSGFNIAYLISRFVAIE